MAGSGGLGCALPPGGAPGLEDLIYAHISARIPGPENHFLINPYGLLFEEITASSLVKVDLDRNVLQETSHHINPAVFTIHSAAHAAREEARFVMTLHTDQGVAVSAQKEGLLPISQQALIAIPQLAYHDYKGIALNLGERERFAADIGDKPMMLLRHYGTLATGETAANCWQHMYFLERACSIQISALSAGRENVLIAPVASQDAVRDRTSDGISGGMAWPACLRKLDRQLPGHEA